MLGILSGLEAEAKIARKYQGTLVTCSAAVPEKRAIWRADWSSESASRLMDFGVCGALDVNLPVGALVVGSGKS